MIHKLIKILKKIIIVSFGENVWGKFRRGINYLLRKTIVPLFGWKIYHKLLFYFYHEYKLNLKHPETFMEILQWQKYYGRVEEYAPFVDKYLVRDYVTKTLGENYLVPLIGVFKEPDSINVENLPQKFVIKMSHGSGWTIIVKDKSKLDWSEIKLKLEKWLRRNYYDQAGEINYKNITKRLILIEEYLDTPNDNLIDYKLWCFNGKFQFIGVHGDRNTEPKGIILDINWNPLPIIYPEIKVWKTIPTKPKNFVDLVTAAEKLASDFPFVRVDLYSIKEKVLFGELTFSPGDGFNIIFPKELDYKFGKLIPLDKYPFIHKHTQNKL